MSNKKQKLIHESSLPAPAAGSDDDEATTTTPPAQETLVQRFRFNTVALPGGGTERLAMSGSFQGTLALPLHTPHDPLNPLLLVDEKDEEDTDEDDETDDPFTQIEISNLSDSSPLKKLFESTMTVVSIDNDDETVQVDFTFHNFGTISSTITCGVGLTSKSERIEMVVSRDQLALLVAGRGGYLLLDATTFGLSTCAGFSVPRQLKLYCVIASKPLPTVTELQLTGVHFRKPDAISFWTLMLGSHARLGKQSPYFLNIEGINRKVFSYLKFKSDFASLERRVDEWMKNSTFPSHYWGSLNAKGLVREYRRFLLLKTRTEDWSSQRLSPPMKNDIMTGYRLLDEGMLLSGGGVHSYMYCLDCLCCLDCLFVRILNIFRFFFISLASSFVFSQLR